MNHMYMRIFDIEMRARSALGIGDVETDFETGPKSKLSKVI